MSGSLMSGNAFDDQRQLPVESVLARARRQAELSWRTCNGWHAGPGWHRRRRRTGLPSGQQPSSSGCRRSGCAGAKRAATQQQGVPLKRLRAHQAGSSPAAAARLCRWNQSGSRSFITRAMAMPTGMNTPQPSSSSHRWACRAADPGRGGGERIVSTAATPRMVAMQPGTPLHAGRGSTGTVPWTVH